MRHGKPVFEQFCSIAPREMEQWVERYDRSKVEPHGVPKASKQFARSAINIVTSSLPRALSSVKVLGRSPSLIDPVFCEAPLPFAHLSFPRLSPFTWAAIFRVLWLFGYSSGSESLHVAQARAMKAAHKLINLTDKGPVLLMGHGVMNRLIGKQLVHLGWAGSRGHDSKYWSAIVYKI